MHLDYKNRIFGLDVLRCTAIIFVLLAHIVPFLGNGNRFFIEMLNMAGFYGVEIFFVLSGFLIGNILYKRFVLEEYTIKTILYFWIRRWFRTLPNYYLVLIINIVVLFLVGYQLPKFTPSEDLWKYFLFAQNLYSEQIIFFPESWSLSIEEYAYLIGPIVIFGVLFFFKRKRQLGFLCATILILLFFFVTKLIYQSNFSEGDMFYWNLNLKPVVIYRIDSIYYGVLGAYVYQNYTRWWKHYRWLLLGIAFILFIGINIYVSIFDNHINNNPLFWNVFALPLYSIIILFTIPFFSYWQESPSWFKKPVTYISIISYGLYLLHYSVTLFFVNSLPRILGIPLPKVLLIGLYLTLSFILASLLYRFYEKPMMDLRDHKLVKQQFEK